MSGITVTVLRKDHYTFASLALKLAGDLLGVCAALVRSNVNPVERVSSLRRLLRISTQILASKLSRELIRLLGGAKSRNVNDEPGVLIILGCW